MAALEIRSKILVKDVMSSPVITVYEKTDTSTVAQLMMKHKIGSIIVQNKSGKPIGIITERDISQRIVAKNIRPKQVEAGAIMSSPLVTITADENIAEAAKLMSAKDFHRLVVMHKGRLEGIISSKDILAVTPELLEIIQEKTRIENQNFTEESENPPLTGYCDSCGTWTEDLRNIEGRFLCEECRDEMAQTEY